MTALRLPLLVLFALAAALPHAVGGEEGEGKPPTEADRLFNTVVGKLEFGHFDEARALLEKHPDAIRNGVSAGRRPLAPFVFRPSHPAYHISQQHVCKAFEILLKHGASPDEPGVLYALLSAGHFPAAGLLLDKTPRPDLGGSYLVAALWKSADAATLEKLIRLQADVNLHDAHFNAVPLEVAIDTKRHDAAQLLIKHDANVNYADASGRTILQRAIRGNADLAMISLLLTHDADPNRADAKGVSPVALAVHHPQSPKLIAALEDRGAKLTPAALIILHKNEQFARAVTDERAANGPEPVHSTTLLQIAARHGNAVAVEHLLKQKARIDAPTPWHPLHAAARAEHVAVARVLLDHGSAVDVRDSREHTPLHIAAETGSAEMVALLLARGAAPKAVTGSDSFVERGWQPLHFAVSRGHLNVAKQLIRAGALRPRNEALLRELKQLAAQRKSDELLRLLESAM